MSAGENGGNDEGADNIVGRVESAHALYCSLTGQSLLLRFDRQRRWYELLRAGFCAQDVERVVRYLQREVRIGRRNPGALKLSNLLEPDRFEEDLNLSRIRLEVRKPAAASNPPRPLPAPVSEEIRRSQCEALRRLRMQLRSREPIALPKNPGAATAHPTAQPAFAPQKPTGQSDANPTK
jgi:hypothetical protein